jgi:hypothetical protein
MDTEFLSAVEEKARSEVGASAASFFFLFGWMPKNLHAPENVAMNGAMSQVSAHFHHTGPNARQYADKQIILVEGLSSVTDAPSISRFLDYGAEVALREFKTRLKSFGSNFSSHEYTWTQNNNQVNRHAYGFLSLSDVIQQLVKLDEDLKSLWPKILPDLVREYYNDYLFNFEEGKRSLLLLPPCVTASVFFPSPDDKRRMGLPLDDPYIQVVPFSRAPKTALAGGFLANREIRQDYT